MPQWSLEKVRELDRADELRPLRDMFAQPAGTLYFNGNSLGLMPKLAKSRVQEVLDTWESKAVEGWFDGAETWLNMSERISALAAPLVGAEAAEVTIANSTTINLHQLLATLYRPLGSKRKILVDETIFRSDLYAIRSHLKLRNLDLDDHLVMVPVRDGFLLSEDDLAERMTGDVAIAVFSSVVYHTGQLLDMSRLVRVAREREIMIGFDCSHSVGCLPHELSRWGADFAFWCGYKYLCGGPGAVAGMCLNRRHFGCTPGIAGWFASNKNSLLEMPLHLDAAPDAAALQISTPFALSMAPLLASLSIISDAGIHALRAKSLRLTGLMIDLFDEQLPGTQLSLVTPRDERRRGGHISLVHPRAEQLCRSMRQQGVVADFRRPDMMRLAPSPLYTSFEDCFAAVNRLTAIMHEFE
jgi:kynureninase